VRYALLVYEAHTSWQNLSTEQQRALHGEYRAVAASPGVTGLYRLRPPVMTTVRVEDGHVVQTEVRVTDTKEHLRAFYLLESDDHGAVVELASRIPAARMGGTVEICPLTELIAH
jgi:hypothetical protein